MFLFGASCVAGLLIVRKRKLRRLHMHVLTSKSYDFGHYFGMDIGGTLTKMVYFQPAEGERSRQECDTQHSEGSLRRIEAFLLSLHSVDRHQSAQREERLELFNQQLGGTIHFCKYECLRLVGRLTENANTLYVESFQSSKMDEMTDFVRHHLFHRYIKKIACTGGGAFKVGKWSIAGCLQLPRGADWSVCCSSAACLKRSSGSRSTRRTRWTRSSKASISSCNTHKTSATPS